MSVSPVNNSIAAYAQRVTSGSTSPSSSMAAAVQEAIETPDVTAKEARAGDKVAIRKLQQEKQAQQQASQTSTQEPGKGTRLDKAA
jgi:hypothetical protein